MSNKGLNVNAVEFKPNPGAAVFVPGATTHTVQNPPTADEESSISPPANVKPEESKIDEGGARGTTKEEAISEQLATVCSVAEPSQTIPNASDANETVQNLQTNGNVVESWDDASESTPEVPGTPGEPADVQEAKSAASTAKKQQSTATPKSKKKDHVNIIFIGHVDAGKSTIGGQIMFLTGMVDKRTLEKYEREAKEKNRESWYLSWALDTNAEERDKGITVEVGRAYFETEKKHFTLLDAPGHKNFVPNMIGGASQADLAILVISARRGEFETGFERGGQTQEHALLVKTAGVKHLVVLINKMDDSTVNWDKARFEECRDKLVPYLKKVGFNPKTDIVFIPCSGLHGDFLKDPAPESLVPWYRGPCFIEYIDNMPPFSRLRDGPLRIPITAKYNDMGTIVLGKVESGLCKKGDNIVMMPNKVTVQVLQIWSDEEEVDDVGTGENVKLKLKNIEEDDILPGFVLCSSDSLCKVGRVFDAQVVVLDRPPTSIIAAGYNAVLHIHAAVEEVSVKALICLIDRKTGEKIPKPRFVKQDHTCVMRLESSEMFCLEPFSEFQQLGRFTLRDEGRTIAIGKVLKVVE